MAPFDNAYLCVYTLSMSTPASTQARIEQIAASCACNNLRRATRVITNLYDAAVQPTGLLATQCPLLVALSLLGPQTINVMAERLVMDRTTLSRNLKPLEERGFVIVMPGEDKRTKVVTLTEAGQQVLEQALPLWEQAQAQVLAHLGEERFTALLNILGLTTSFAGYGDQ